MLFTNELARLKNRLWPSKQRSQTAATRRRGSATLRHSYDQLQKRNLLATFTGVGGDIVVNFVDGRPATVEIDGQTFVNPDSTLQLERAEDLADFGGMFGLRPNVTSLALSGDDFDVEVLGDGSLNVNNGAVTYVGNSGPLTLTTGDGDDFIDATQDPRAVIDSFFTGAGDDTFVLTGNASISVELGDGDDHYIQNSTISSFGFGGVEIDAGDGNDLFESTHIATRYSGENFERVIAPEPSNVLSLSIDTMSMLDGNLFTELSPNARITIDGNIATVFREDGTQTQFENFNLIRGARFNSNFIVRSSTFPLTIEGANNVVLGGDFLNGDTSGIQEQLSVRGANQVIVSQSGSTQSQDVFVSRASVDSIHNDTFQILGLTQRALFVDSVESTILAGGTANDRFFVTEIDSRLVLYGNEGDDQFVIGHNQNGAARNLALAGNLVSIVAGSGNDFLRADDSGSGANRHLRVRNNWIHSSGSSPDTEFQGINFLGIENVDLTANQFTDRFLISPSLTTRFVIRGGEDDLEFNSLYRLQTQFNSISTLVGPFSGFNTYLFDNGFQSIFIRV